MAYLLDTNILVRLSDPNLDLRHVAAQAILHLIRSDAKVWITAQNLIEFRNVATRPIAVNGLGHSPEEAVVISTYFESVYPLLPETPDIFPAWKALVEGVGVIGKQVHDARLVAVCHVHRVSHLLTFNVKDFHRLAQAEPGITVVDPRSL